MITEQVPARDNLLRRIEGRARAGALLILCAAFCGCAGTERALEMNDPPAGFIALFNGSDLEGWKGLVANPPARAAMAPDELSRAQAAADERMRAHWRVENGELVFDGAGESLCSARDFADFELLVDWMILPGGDSGIYLRGTPQVQIWDHEHGSGGLYNNQQNPSRPLAKADRPPGEWNSFRIVMQGERVTVYLNGVLVVENAVMENYWERQKPIYSSGAVELQSHGNILRFRNIFIRELLPRGGSTAAAASRLPGASCGSACGQDES